MWYFVLKVSPKPKTQLAIEAAGAFVNCWIDFREQEGAEQLAKFYLTQEGWDFEETQEATWVDRTTYDPDSEGMGYFLEAEANSSCFVVHQWPPNGEDQD
jgi:hypothetical protein